MKQCSLQNCTINHVHNHGGQTVAPKSTLKAVASADNIEVGQVENTPNKPKLCSTDSDDDEGEGSCSSCCVGKKKSFLFNSEYIVGAISLVALIISFIFTMKPLFSNESLNKWLDPAWIAIILCGVPIIMAAFKALITNFNIKAGLLIALAIIAATAVGELFAAGEVAFLMMIGEILEDKTLARSKQGIDRLLKLKPTMARIVENSVEQEIDAAQVQVGQIIRVRPGETIAVDGEIISGQTAIDQAVITGESVPIDVGPGDNVLSGTLNKFSAFDFKATKVGEDSSFSKLIRLVETADTNKARVARIADKMANFIIPIALLISILVYVFTGDIIRAVTILIVFCPCALILATPTAIAAAVGVSSRHGVLIRSGQALELLGGIKYISFDKTGTLTLGSMKVENIKSFKAELSEEKLLELVATLEYQSNHPLAIAVVKKAKEDNLNIDTEVNNFKMVPGKGIEGEIDNKKYFAGNLSYMDGLKINENIKQATDNFLKEGQTLIFLANEEEVLGLLGLTDTIRPESKEIIETVKSLGLKVMLLTGDNKAVAENVAKNLGIDEVRADLLPEDKLNAIQEVLDRGETIAMIGDGLNDAPALKLSTVGLVMGDIASDATIEAADIALLAGNLKSLPFLLKLSKKTLNTIWVNITISIGLSVIAMVLAVLGYLGPVLGALVHNLAAIIVVLNAIRLFKFKFKTE